MLICGANLVGTSMFVNYADFVILFSGWRYSKNILKNFSYVYMNFMPAPPAVIIAGQVAWQYIHGERSINTIIAIVIINKLPKIWNKDLIKCRRFLWMLLFFAGLPPFIYLALNKSIRQFALKSIGLGEFFRGFTTVKNHFYSGSMYETQRVTNISLTQGTR